MAARKGIRAKMLELVLADPDRVWTGAEVEDTYISLGGAVAWEQKDGTRRVSHDSIKRVPASLFMESLDRGGRWYSEKTWRESTWRFSPEMKARHDDSIERERRARDLWNEIEL